MPLALSKLHESATKNVEQGKTALQGISFIYGNTPLRCFEACAFMTSLGMEPKLIQCHDITSADGADVEQILTCADPYITQAANISPMQYIYDVLRPMLYLGHEYPMRLRKKGIALVHTDLSGGMLGYEITEYFVKQLIDSAAEAEGIRRGGAAQ